MTAVLIPKNWKSFQHYGARRPPWIKLHRSLLDNFDFHRLPDASKALAPMLWLLASEYEAGHVPLDFEMLEFRLRIKPAAFAAAFLPLLNGGFFDASKDAMRVLAGGYQQDGNAMKDDASGALSSDASAAIGSEEKSREEDREEDREEGRACARPPAPLETIEAAYGHNGDPMRVALGGAPPIRDLVRDPPLGAGAWAVELRKRGVSITSQHPTLCLWIKDGLPLDAVLEALEVARLRKPMPALIAPNYLDAIVRGVQTAAPDGQKTEGSGRGTSLAEMAAQAERLVASGELRA